MRESHTWEEAAVRWLLETKHKATHGDDKAKLRWLDTYLGGRQLEEIDRTLIDRIKFDREKIATAGTTNRYLALIRAILRRACDEWEWIDRVPKFKLFREAEGRVRSLSPAEFDKLRSELPELLADMAVFSVATGLRQANVKRLEWSFVDVERRHAWVRASDHKNRKAHSVPLNEMAVTVLRRQLGKHSTRVFTFCGEPIVQVSTKAWRDAQARRHRGLPLARSVAHVCDVAPPGGHADARTAAAGWMENRCDGGTLRPPCAGGAARCCRPVGWLE